MAIGETVLSAVLGVIFDRLASNEVINFFRRSKIDQALVHKLKTLMLATEKLLFDAEEKQMTDHAVKQWLDDLKHWFYRAEEVVDEIALEALQSSMETKFPSEPQLLGTKVRNLIPAFCTSSSFLKTATLNIKEIVSMLESMLNQKDALGLRELSVGIALQRVPTGSLLGDTKVYGRDLEKEKIVEFLLYEKSESNKFGVLAIVGMGGVGKTTLAKMVYNDKRLEETFDQKAWVCVSDQFDISKVTRSILESLTHQSYSWNLDLNFLQIELSAKLRDKKFLLVLDDVWNEKYEDWDNLRSPFYDGANGSKIIVTTRNDGVAAIMCTKSPFPLKPLSEDDAWSLFSRHAFELGNVKSYGSLEHIGRKIVQKCRGLPLATKALGGLLRCKLDSTEWEAILHSTLWDLLHDKSNVIPALWLSYYHLPGHLKRCFSYCAIFPKDYKIDRKKLVLLWMAENFVLPTNNKRIEDVGDEYLSRLLSMSFFEPIGKSYVTMHDLMHDLAQGVFGNFLVRNDMDSMSKGHRRARHFSYVSDSFYDVITKFEAIRETTFLRTFLQLQSWQTYLTSEVSTLLKPSLSCLRVLSLSRCENLRLTELIECPKQLRYLDVSHTTISLLPEWVSSLCNLQTLILSDCRNLERLPADVWRLRSLRSFDIRGATLLSHMPKQMSKLTSLQTLTDFVVGKNIGSGIQELRELQQIRGRFAIRRLQNVTVPSDAYAVNLGSWKSIDDLELEFDSIGNNGSEKDREVLENLKPPLGVERLTIRNYGGTALPKWLDLGCALYKEMTFLCLSNCQYCIALPPLGQLPSLRTLEIEGMDYIQVVGHEFYGYNSCGSFPVLESLCFKNMKGWEVWSNLDGRGTAVSFPCLKKLSLCGCPKLKGNLPGRLSLLNELQIHGCEELGGLLPRVPSIHVLQLVGCPHVKLARAFDVTSITTLRLEGLVNLVDLPPHVVMLSFLRDLVISKCDNLRSLSNVRLPPTLESLTIEECEGLECLPEGMVSLTHFQRLILYKCNCLRWVSRNSLPTSLRELLVAYCESWDFPIPLERMQHYTCIEKIYFWNAVSRLVSFPLGIFPNLRFLTLNFCKGLEKVYIPERIDDSGLTSLSYLYIHGCAKLKTIGNETGRGKATILPAPNLTDLSISECEKVKPLLIEREGEVLLPELRHVTISNSSKLASESPISLRRSLCRFSCLRILTIEGDEVECFPDLKEGWGSLPTFLTHLSISDCPKLRRVDGKVLQTLTFLEQLFLTNCPKLERLPEEGLPPSLGYLCIIGCPMVEERCWPQKGRDWTIIHHIPFIWINDRRYRNP